MRDGMGWDGIGERGGYTRFYGAYMAFILDSGP